MSRILVTGGAGGLGHAILMALDDDHDVFAFDVADGHDVRTPNRAVIQEMVGSELDVLINCAGVNRQDWIESMEDATWDRVMGVNAMGLWKMTAACLPMLRESQGTVLNITSNAAWMPMTGSLAYNASKGAAHIMTLQMARELTKKYGITVFGIAPNKLKGTNMSAQIESEVLRVRGWTKEFAEQYQKNALLTGEETDPHVLAEFVAFLLKEKRNHSQLSGCIIPYGA